MVLTLCQTEWFIADVGAIAAGGIAAGIYTTNGPDACHYIADHCEALVVFVENEIQLKKILAVRNKLPHMKAIVQWSGKAPEGEKDVYSWEDFMKLGSEVDTKEVEDRIAPQQPGHCSTLIYTSGTTGPPKAVMISHDNTTWTAKVVCEMMKIGNSDSLISYLPLSHIAAQMLDIHAPMFTGASIWFAQPDALRGSLGTTLKEVRPTLFLGVPRVWEKIMEKMQEIAKSVTGVKKSISTWAKAKGLEGGYAIQKGEGTPWGWWLANQLVFGKVKEALGLDRTRYCATAAAPIGKETLEYFLALNIPIYEIYGMSECTGPQTLNRPKKHKTASAGASMPGTELKLDNPDKDGNGEICYRGRHIFMGYLKNDKATAETIDDEGWLHSGDIGRLDKDGFLYITGRIKELIITAGGENVPPVLIEDEIKLEIGKVVSNVMVVGDRRKFLTCLITLKTTPNAEVKPGDYPFTDNLAPSALEELQKFGSSAKTVEEAMKDEKVKEYINKGIERSNKRATSNAQRIGKFRIVPRDFTLEGGELTPSLKLKRRVVVQQYEKEIEELYAEAQQ